MEEDIKCLPDDFVGNSKPSIVIKKLYQKRENAEKDALELMNTRKKEISEKYEKVIERESEALNKKLDDIKGIIKNELFESKIRANNDNANNLEKESFENMLTMIQNYTKMRQDLVEEFYENLRAMENKKSKEFKEVLKCTYEEIKKISFKLPSEYDEYIELEIEKINQTILCNHRNYLEIKNQLQLEIENDNKKFVQELRHVKECWVKYLRSQTNKAINNLKSQNFRSIIFKNVEVLKSAQNMKNEALEIKEEIENVDSVTKLKQAEEWLRSLRHTLAKLDFNAQRIMINYKQAAVYVFNRFFQELKVIAEQLNEMIDTNEIESVQCEMYTPTIEEINKMYKTDLETIQRVWTDLVDQMAKTVDNTYRFLKASATLWEKHFKRTEVLQVVALKDLDNAIRDNNSSAQPWETKLNVLIDILRQEPTKEKLNKTLEDIKKLLYAMEDLYKNQYQIEIGIYKKYKPIQDFKIDLLLSEVKRFLVIYPPDLEKDPKIQRKRASQTSEIADPEEAIIPNQMIYCKFQIDAISNWQFGLWEAISNYTAVARTEIMADFENWVKIQIDRLNRRLEVRLAVHSLRMEKITGYIYDVRMEELCIHQRRFEEHQNAIEKRTNELKEELGTYLEKYQQMFEVYNEQMDELKNKCLNLPSSTMVTAHKAILRGKTNTCLEDINILYKKYLEKCDNFFERVKASHIKYSENMKLFSEGGNFAIQETKDYLKHLSKIEDRVNKNMVGIKKNMEDAKEKICAKVETRNDEVLNMLHLVIEEHVFYENFKKKIKCLEKELIKEVCDFEIIFRDLNRIFGEYRHTFIVSCGSYTYFQEHFQDLKSFLNSIENLGKFLYHPSPVVWYSDKTSVGKEHPHKSEEQDYTSKLFSFVNNEENTFFMNLNKILLKNWNDIISYAKGFYTSHHRDFYLDESKVYHTLGSTTKEMYEKFMILQNQCETKWIENTRDYLIFLNNFLSFYQEYTDVYLEEHARKSLKCFDKFFENWIRQPIEHNKKNIKNMYLELQKKLKPLYGHPNNRSLLEKLEVEAKLIEIEAREILADNAIPLVKLQECYDLAVEKFRTLQTVIPQCVSFLEPLKHVKEELLLKLTEKVQLLKKFIKFEEEVEENINLKEPILKHCKSFLTFYEKLEIPTDFYGNDIVDEQASLTFKSMETEKTTSKNNASLKTSGESKSTMILTIEEAHVFLLDLKETFDKYCKQLEEEDFEEFIEVLKKEWDYAVKAILDLYKVKYDQ